MAGPITGTWLRQSVASWEESGGLKWGTGVNPVHKIPGDILGEPPVRQNAKLNLDTPDLGPGDETSQYVTGVNPPVPEDEDSALYGADCYNIWGYGSETGLTDRAPLSESGYLEQRINQTNFPPWGGSRKVMPGGNFIRSVMRGALATNAMRVLPNETVGEGWENKAKGEPADALPSDDSQLIMNSSVTQRYKVRTGSQSTGRASEYSAPVESRVVGQKVKVYSDSENRRWDMFPFQQDDIIRPFVSRQAGTGYQEWATTNEMYQAIPRQREVAPDPYPGTITPEDDSMSGYSYEDVTY